MICKNCIFWEPWDDPSVGECMNETILQFFTNIKFHGTPLTMKYNGCSLGEENELDKDT